MKAQVRTLIEFEFYGVRVIFCFSFFAAAAIMSAVSGDVVLPAMISCFLHECGHIAAMAANGVKLRSIKFYGAGIMMTPRKKLLSPCREAVVLLAGCAVNFLLCIFFCGTAFGYINLFLGVFNLLPAGGLDGGRLLSLFLNEAMPCRPEAAVLICRLAGIFCAAVLLASAVIFRITNPTIYVAGVLMFVSAVIGSN